MAVTPLGTAPVSLVVPTMVRFPTDRVPEVGPETAMVGPVVSRVKSLLVWLVFPAPEVVWT